MGECAWKYIRTAVPTRWEDFVQFGIGLEAEGRQDEVEGQGEAEAGREEVGVGQWPRAAAEGEPRGGSGQIHEVGAVPDGGVEERQQWCCELVGQRVAYGGVEERQQRFCELVSQRVAWK